MRKRKYLRKLYAAALIGGMLCTGTGCVATPDSSIVTQKNDERLKETAKEGADKNNNLSAVAKKADSHYDYKYENTDKTLTVTADADVWIPDKEKVPMYEVAGGQFSQELVTKTYDYFFHGEDTYEENEDGTQIQVDSTLKENTAYTANGEETYMGLNCGNDTGIFWVDNWASDSAGQSTMQYMAENNMYSYSGWAGQGITLLNDEEKNSAGKEIGISYGEAKKIADDFWTELGIEVEECAVSGVSGMPKNSEEFQEENSYTAYKFIYIRILAGIPFAATTSVEVPMDESTVSWCYEQIQLFVEPEGIVWMDWDYPVETKEIISENVGILSFDDAAEIFEQMIPIIYEGRMEGNENAFGIDVNVHKAELALMRVRDSGSDRTGVLTPTWVFYGNVKENFHAYDEYNEEWMDWTNEEEEPWIVLAVNAVDGSVINIVEGY